MLTSFNQGVDLFMERRGAMGRAFRAIADAVENYERLCRKYEEPVQYKPGRPNHEVPDWESEHAISLLKREAEELSQSRNIEEIAV